MQTTSFKKDVKQGKLAERFLHKYFFIKQNPNSVLDDTEYPSEDQFAGVDIVVNMSNGTKVYHDIKAQMDYINNPKQTFIMELSYLKDGVEKLGWALRTDLKTNFYTIALIHRAKLLKGQLVDFEDIECAEIVMVHKSKIFSFLRGIEERTGSNLYNTANAFRHSVLIERGKKPYDFIDGTMIYCSTNKAEKPVCLVVKLEKWLELMPEGKNLHYLVTKNGFFEVPADCNVNGTVIDNVMKHNHI